MSDKRRIIIIIVSVLSGTILSLLIFKVRKGTAGLNSQDYSTLITNFVFSLAIILGIGFLFLWRKKKDEE
jgi:hypothetical protein